MSTTSIYEAAMAGDLVVVKSKVECDGGKVVHDLDAGGWSALHWAAARGHGLVASYLIDQGASINQQTRHYHSTALYLACEKGHVDMVSLLLHKGADSSIADSDGWTPLEAACFRGHCELVERLLSREEHKYRDSRWAERALGCAAFRGHKGVVRVLLEAGADPTQAVVHGISPIGIAELHGHADCVRLLEEWDRCYSLTKARRLQEASRAIAAAGSLYPPPTSTATMTAPTCLANTANLSPRKKCIATTNNGPTTRSAKLNTTILANSRTTTTTTTIHSPTKRQREWEVAPAYLRRRIEDGEALPRVEMIPVSDRGSPICSSSSSSSSSSNSTTSSCDSVVTSSVLAYVLGDMKDELFVELTKMLLAP